MKAPGVLQVMQRTFDDIKKRVGPEHIKEVNGRTVIDLSGLVIAKFEIPDYEHGTFSMYIKGLPVRVVPTS